MKIGLCSVFFWISYVLCHWGWREHSSGAVQAETFFFRVSNSWFRGALWAPLQNLTLKRQFMLFLCFFSANFASCIYQYCSGSHTHLPSFWRERLVLQTIVVILRWLELAACFLLTKWLRELALWWCIKWNRQKLSLSNSKYGVCGHITTSLLHYWILTCLGTRKQKTEV